MRFRKCTLGRLPRVMVYALALNENDHECLVEELLKLATQANGSVPDEWPAAIIDAHADVADDDDPLARMFVAVLELPKAERDAFARAFDRMLDRQGDLFGTEGQLDPRGDRRG